MELRASGEDYLEAIWVLQKKNGAVRSIDVVRHLDRSKPSVSRAIHLLQAGGFLEVDGRLLCLTDSGRAAAERIYERRRFFAERLLALGIDPATAEADACRLGHAISAESFARLKGASGQQGHK